MTGIDRVEYAYLTRLLAEETPLFGLVRSAAGWLLLDRTGCEGLRVLAQGAALPAPDLISRVLHRTNPTRARAETAARRLSIARGLRPGLARLLRHLPLGASYLNVGHSDLTDKGLATLARLGVHISVLIHDTIPLDHPEFARPDTIEPFRTKLAAVSAHAARVIHITKDAQSRTEAQMARFGRVPPGIVALNGVEMAAPDPNTVLPTAPYFVTLGTIEPRKNHALLLDVWAQMPTPAPRLYIIGNRGWADASLLARLDALPPDGPIRLLHGLSDGAVAALVQGASALLAPSLAEGFGLPPVEAACLGTRVIASDLGVTREILGDMAVYLNGTDIYSWMETIVRYANSDGHAKMVQPSWKPPSWDAHFKAVLSLG